MSVYFKSDPIKREKWGRRDAFNFSDFGTLYPLNLQHRLKKESTLPKRTQGRMFSLTHFTRFNGLINSSGLCLSLLNILNDPY